MEGRDLTSGDLQFNSVRALHRENSTHSVVIQSQPATKPHTAESLCNQQDFQHKSKHGPMLATQKKIDSI